MSERKITEIAKFDEVDESWVGHGGLWTRCVCIGRTNDPASPIGVAIKAEPEVGDLVAGRKSFGTSTLTVVLSGSVLHDSTWMLPGDMYVAPANYVNGDLLFGPDGAVIFIMFQCRSGMVPTFVDKRDQARFDELLRVDVESVAMGRCEKSVSILPSRDEPMVARAVQFHSVDEVAQYRERVGTDW